jgi:hypothetical protein
MELILTLIVISAHGKPYKAYFKEIGETMQTMVYCHQDDDVDTIKKKLNKQIQAYMEVNKAETNMVSANSTPEEVYLEEEIILKG